LEDVCDDEGDELSLSFLELEELLEWPELLLELEDDLSFFDDDEELLEELLEDEEDDLAFRARCEECEPWNVVTVSSEPREPSDLQMVDHFILRLFPAGHIKSTTPDDKDFVRTFEASSKWLRFVEP